MRLDIMWTILIGLTVIVGAIVGLMIYIQSHYREAIKKATEGKPQEALNLFMKIVGWQGKHVPSLWQLAQLNLSLDKTETAVKHLQKIISIMDKEPKKNEAAARWEVTEAEVLSKLAWSLSKLNRRAEAIAGFRRLLAVEAGNKEARIEAGKLLYATRDYDACIEMFEGVVTSEPDNAEVLELLSNALSAKGEHGRAAETLSRRLAADRQNVNLWIRLANLHRTAKNNSKQGEAWRVVMDITPEDDANHISAVVQLGKLAYIEEDYAKSVETLKRADLLCPSGDDRTFKTIKYYLGLGLMKSGRKGDALTAFSAVYEQDPNYKDVRELLRDSLELLSDDDLAQEIQRMRADKFSALAAAISQLLGFRPVTVESINNVDVRVDAKLEETGKDRNVLLYFERSSNGDVGELAIRTFLIECDERHVEHPVFLTTGGFTFEAQLKGKDHRMRLMPRHDFCDLVRKTRTAA